MNEFDEFEEEEMIIVVFEEVKEKWDCEFICSIYLNLYNYLQFIKY